MAVAPKALQPYIEPVKFGCRRETITHPPISLASRAPKRLLRPLHAPGPTVDTEDLSNKERISICGRAVRFPLAEVIWKRLR